MTLHVGLANDDDPARHVIGNHRPRNRFSPAERYQSYIRVKGITFQYAGNGFPVPQRGMVSTNRGDHFIFEDNAFEWANSVASRHWQRGLGRVASAAAGGLRCDSREYVPLLWH